MMKEEMTKFEGSRAGEFRETASVALSVAWWDAEGCEKVVLDCDDE